MLKIFKLLLSVALIAGMVFGGVFLYRSCSLKGCEVTNKFSYETPILKTSNETTNEGYTGVLEDLQSDENFNIDEYPENAADYSLQVIQIAESSEKRLFLYVYQPSGNSKPLTATTVRLSTAINDNANWLDYSVTLVSSAVTLQKYVVNELTVKPDKVRYYDIAAMHRKWDKEIDPPPEDDNTISEVVYEVAQRWTVFFTDGKVNYAMQYIETVYITEKYCDFIRYPDGHIFSHPLAFDSHYVAFSTDRNIDKLMEATVGYFRDTGTYRHFESIPSLDSWQSKLAYRTETTIYAEDTNSNPGNGWFAPSYTWKVIERVTDFVASKDYTLSSTALKGLENKQWVLRFLDTDYKKYNDNLGNDYTADFTKVSDVTILRLKFETDGNVYNLGVVDNKQSGSLIPGGIGVGGCEAFFARIWNFICEHWNLVVLISVILIAVIIGVKILTLVWGK